MLALYSSDPKQLSRMRAALPASEQVVATDNWNDFQSSAAAADCSVVAVEWLNDDGVVSRLFTFKARFPLEPLIVVTHKDADNLRCLTNVHAEGVVWPSEVTRFLWPAVGRARSCCVLRRLAAMFERAESISPQLRAALALACRSEPPVLSVARLARATGCDRRTLWRHWHEASGGAPPVRLEDVLHWLLLLRAVGRKAPGQSWAAVAVALGVHEHTIARLTRRLTGLTLRALAVAGQPAVLAIFGRKVLQPLLIASEWDNLG